MYFSARKFITRILILYFSNFIFSTSSISETTNTTTTLASKKTTVFAKGAFIGAELKLVENVVITIVDDRIVELAQYQNLKNINDLNSNNAQHIDLSCCFVLPGLIDTQTHLVSQPLSPPKKVRISQWSNADFTLVAMENARKTLLSGFTSIRDMGNTGDSVFAVRRAVNNGTILGPRMQVSGEVIRPTGGELRPWLRTNIERLLSVDSICDGPEDCMRAVRASVAAGATTIKVETKQDLSRDSASQFTYEELTAIKDAAHALGVDVTASGFSIESINLPLRAGFDGVVHGTFTNAETYDLLKENNAFFIPTLQAAQVVYELASDPETPVSDSWRKENIAIYHGMVESFKNALASDINIAFGTDAGWRNHGENAAQLIQMVKLGMSPRQALMSASVTAAKAIGWENDVGAIDIGKYADFLVTESNPLQFINTVTKPVMVIKGGQVVSKGDVL